MSRVTANIVLDVSEMKRLVEILGPKKLPKILFNVVRAMQLLLAEHVITSKLTGQYLKRQTGTLIRSVSASTRVKPSVRSNPARVRGVVGTPLGYGKAHEIGFSGEVSVRAHSRRLFRKSTSKAGKTRKKLLRSVARVQAHARKMEITAKHYLRDSLVEKKPLFVRLNSRALAHAIRTGTIPSPAAIIKAAG